jgi:EF-hand domain
VVRTVAVRIRRTTEKSSATSSRAWLLRIGMRGQDGTGRQEEGSGSLASKGESSMKYSVMLAALLLASAEITNLHAQEAPSDNTEQAQSEGSDSMMGDGMGGMMDGGMGGMMGHGMGGMMGHGRMCHGMRMRGPMMRVMFIMLDTDGDGALSLEEVQSFHARIFKAIDADKNGKVTLEEIQKFLRSQ